MQSLIEKANNGGHFKIVNNRQNWKNDWFTPTHSAPANPVSSGADGVQLNDGVSVEKYPFKFKSWIKTDECTWRKVLEANDSMDLLDASTYSAQDEVNDGVSHDQQTANRPANGESLTVEDIRGAVGSVDGISGFSSSDAQAQTKQEPEQRPATVTDQNHEQNHEQSQNQNQDLEPNQSPEQKKNLEQNSDPKNQDQDRDQDQDVNMDRD